MIIRCDSAAIVENTSELLPEPETPVNTVRRRLGSSTLMSLRLFSRAPCTRIRSWLSAGAVFGSVVMLVSIRGDTASSAGSIQPEGRMPPPGV